MIVLSFTRIFRLLDVCLGRKTLYETQIMLVFEHIDQDLDMYLKEAPEAGLEDNQIKVWLCLHYAGTSHSDSVFKDRFNELCLIPIANSLMLLVDFQQNLNFKAVAQNYLKLWFWYKFCTEVFRCYAGLVQASKDGTNIFISQIQLIFRTSCGRSFLA